MTLQELKNTRLKRYLECEEKILLNQEYTIGGRTYKRADLDAVRKMITTLLEEGAVLDESEVLVNGRIKHIIFG